jgi:hypothetical protein
MHKRPPPKPPRLYLRQRLLQKRFRLSPQQAVRLSQLELRSSPTLH